MRTASCCLLGLVACTTRPPIAAQPPANPSRQPPIATLDPRFVAIVRDAAAPYQTWGRVDAKPNVAPMLCDMPRPHSDVFGSRGRVHMSEAEDAPHGNKLYYLWASDRKAYLALGERDSVATGFAIVKQSFTATPTVAPPDQPDTNEPPLHAKLRVGNAWLTTGDPKGLYVMTKRAATEGTDAGWIYGTITPDGEVTSAGQVASCIACHENAPHDRLFGAKPATSEIHGH